MGYLWLHTAYQCTTSVLAALITNTIPVYLATLPIGKLPGYLATLLTQQNQLIWQPCWSVHYQVIWQQCWSIETSLRGSLLISTIPANLATLLTSTIPVVQPDSIVSVGDIPLSDVEAPILTRAAQNHWMPRPPDVFLSIWPAWQLMPWNDEMRNYSLMYDCSLNYDSRRWWRRFHGRKL